MSVSSVIYSTNLKPSVLQLAVAVSILEDHMATSFQKGREWKPGELYGALENGDVLQVVFLRYEGHYLASYISSDDGEVVVACEDGTPEETVMHFVEMIIEKVRPSAMDEQSFLEKVADRLQASAACGIKYLFGSKTH